MTSDDYKQRLIRFNETDKYRQERDFLVNLMQPQADEKILDYGTGLGRMVYYLNQRYNANCYGYDLHNYREHDSQFLFRSKYYFRFNKVFFMHSLAHIANIEERLTYLRENLMNAGSRVYLITPNKEWLRGLELAKSYVADPTVVEHYTSAELQSLFTNCGFKLELLGQFGEVNRGQHERLFLQAVV